MVQVSHLFFLKAATLDNSFIKKSNHYNFLNPYCFDLLVILSVQ